MTKQSRPGSPAGADRRTRQQRGALRRQQILDAAVQLFAKRGTRGTDVADIAQHLGISSTGMMYYFGSKTRLVLEVMAERDRADAIDFAEELTLADLRELGRHNVETELLTRLYVVIGAESLEPDEPLHGFFVERYETTRTFMRSVLEWDRARGRIRSDVDLDHTATEMLSVVMGAEFQWLADPKRVDLAQVIETYIDQLVVRLAP